MPFPQPADPLQQVMAHPEFPAPLALALLQEAPNAILPGLGAFPMNRVALLETNPSFIEAFLVGVNHEMNREFLWREFPTDQRGTPFKHFWPRPPQDGGDGREIEEIVRWRVDRRLGTNLAGGRGAETVLLVRGEVLRRFPYMIVMAAPAIDAAGTPGPFSAWRLPKFPVPFGNDSMAYVFDLDVNEALGLPGWFFVFQEPRAVPRYGFDVSSERRLRILERSRRGPTCRSHARSSSTSIRRWRSGLPIRAAPCGAARPRTWRTSRSNVRSGSSSTPGHSSMSNLSDLIEARGQLVARREQLSACETALVDNELRTRNATARLREVLEGATDPDTAAVRAFRQRELGVLPEEREKLEEQRDTLTARNRHPRRRGRNARSRGAGAVDVDRHAGCALSGAHRDVLQTCGERLRSARANLSRRPAPRCHTRPAHGQGVRGGTGVLAIRVAGDRQRRHVEADDCRGLEGARQAHRSRAHRARRRRDTAGERATGSDDGAGRRGSSLPAAAPG